MLVRKEEGRKLVLKQDSAKLAIAGAISGAASLRASFGILSGPGAFLLGIDCRIPLISEWWTSFSMGNFSL